MSTAESMVHHIFSLILSCMSGIFLVLAFPTYDFSWLAFVGFVPLLYAITGKRPIVAFSLSYVCGLIFFSGVFAWILSVPGYDFRHQAMIIPYLAIYFGVMGWIYSYVSGRLGIFAAFCTAPFIWVCLEFIRSNVSFLSLPWALLSHTQYRFHHLIQIASITGAYGISFFVFLINIALLSILLQVATKRRGVGVIKSQVFLGSFPLLVLSLSTALFIAGALFYGEMLLNTDPGDSTVRTSVLQGNIDREMKKNPQKYDRFIMETYTGMTREAFQDKPDLIVWPEASTPGFVLKNLSLYQKMSVLIQEGNSYFLVGSAEYAKFITPEVAEKREVGNTALFFSPAGKVLGQYLKINLVPFGEYVPLKDIVPWPSSIVPPSKKEVKEIPGREFTLFSMKDTEFGVLICWEVVFPDLFRQFVKNGANFMINISNEGWFGDTAAPHQMVAINVFRAVENRIAVARSANTGISCFFDPFGRITGRVVDENGKDTFIKGFLTQDIPLMYKRTFYTKYGDIFAYGCIVVSIMVIIITAFVRSGSVGGNC